MPNELLFRIIFSALYLCFFAVILYTRYESRGTAAKSLVRRRAQKIRERDLRIVLLALLAPFWYAGLLLYALLPSWIAFLSINLPAWLRLAMACVAAAGLASDIHVRYTALTDTNTPKIRHPACPEFRGEQREVSLCLLEDPRDSRSDSGRKCWRRNNHVHPGVVGSI